MSVFSKIGRAVKSRTLLLKTHLTLSLGGGEGAALIKRQVYRYKILNGLRKKYKKFIEDYKSAHSADVRGERSGYVWVCWLQGAESAPPIVKACRRSLEKGLAGRRITDISEANYSEYVTLPAYIVEKYKKGYIAPAHFSDILRLALLNKYGGTWIDASIYLSGGYIPAYMLDSDLFMFRCLWPEAEATYFDNWFITACSRNPLLELAFALYCEFWKKHNSAPEYWISYDLLGLAVEAYPEEWAKVTPFSRVTAHILQTRLFDKFSPGDFEEICRQTPFHKLTYKFGKDKTDLPDTYYKYILARQGD